MVPIEWRELLLRLGIAALLGAIVGLDRELRHKPTELRTVTSVSIGAALFTLLALQMASVTAAAGYDPTGDIGRILQGLVSGIGILGAGVFLHRGRTVRLATTGASVWLAGASASLLDSVFIFSPWRRQCWPSWCWLASGVSNDDFSSRATHRLHSGTIRNRLSSRLGTSRCPANGWTQTTGFFECATTQRLVCRGKQL